MASFSGRVKCAARAALVLAAIAVLLLATGCGSGSNNGGGGGGGNSGFSNASLNGSYAFSQRGYAIPQSGQFLTDAFSEAGVFTADGQGHVTNVIDEFSQSGTFFPAKGAPITGGYTVNSDGTGLLQFNFGGNQFTNFRIVFTDSSHFYMIEQDSFATGTGSGEKQDTSAFNVTPSGDFVFQARTAQDNTNNRSGRVGSMALAGGAITGLEDKLAVFGNVDPLVPFTGAVPTAPDSTGLGEIILSDGTSFRYYVVNAGKFRLLSTTGSLELGVAEAQTGGPFSNATLAAGSSYVFGSSGDSDLQVGVHSAGVFSTDGNGNVTIGATDLDFDGTILSNVAIQNTSNYSIDTNTGRGVLNLDLANNTSKQDVFWMVSPSRAYLLVNSNAAIEDGTFLKQQGTPFTNTSLNKQAGFFMDGFDLAYKDRVGTITPDGNGNLKWNQQSNSFDTSGNELPSSFSTTGSSQVDSNGRVTVTVNGLVNGTNSSLVFYLITTNTGFVVAEDPGFDLGGAFTVQTGP
jgi:hypothetical protein